MISYVTNIAVVGLCNESNSYSLICPTWCSVSNRLGFITVGILLSFYKLFIMKLWFFISVIYKLHLVDFFHTFTLSFIIAAEHLNYTLLYRTPLCFAYPTTWLIVAGLYRLMYNIFSYQFAFFHYQILIIYSICTIKLNCCHGAEWFQ